jgi:hypothetical protein
LVRTRPLDWALAAVFTRWGDKPVQARSGVSGTGQGLVGLRERVQGLGGHLLAGPTAHGGWLVEATLPAQARLPAGPARA